MTGQQLKNSILQMAVSGKLVPQDPNDEPASALLERIRTEKERLVKEGKIKKEKNPSRIFRGSDNLPYEQIGNREPVCIADEVPFEIPESWEWCRLGSIFAILNGDRGKNYPAKSTLSSSGIPFISALNLDGSSVVQDDNLLCMSEKQYERLGNGKLIKGDIVVCIRGSLGKHGKYPFERGAIASSLVILRSYMEQDYISDYVMMYLDAPIFFFEIKKYDNGTAQPNLSARNLERFFIPVPPLAEQQRIVEKYEELLPFINEYSEKEQQTQELNETFPDQLRKSILQYAVQGKLVPQDPLDEPASVLLDRIRAEKERLIAAGKIKRDKHESIIYRRDNSHYEKIDGVERCIDDEIPFEIPENWAWARLGNIGDWGSGATPSRTHPEYYGGSIPWLKTGDLNDGYIESVPEHITNMALENTSVRINPIGSVLIAMYGATIGKLGILAIPATTNQACCACIPYADFYNKYLFYFLMSQKQAFIKRGEGGAQPNISKEKIVSTLMPIPPVSEQYRIVEKAERLLALCKSMQS